MKTDRQEWLLAALKRYEAPLVRYAARITGDLERARDVVQEAFLKLWKAQRSEVEHKLAPWLYTVVRHHALDVRKKESRMVNVEMTEQKEGHLGANAPVGSSKMEARQAQSQMLALLDSLPENQREVIRLKFQEDLSYKDISKVTGLSVSNVGFLIHTGIKAMRAEMESSDSQEAADGTTPVAGRGGAQ